MGPVQRRLSALAVVTAAALLTAGCGDDGSDPAAVTDAPPELAAGAVQYRSDVPLNQMRLLISNESSGRVTVERLRLSWPGLDEVDDAQLDYAMRPGETSALPIPFGAADCSAAMPSVEDAVAVVTLGGTGEQRVPLTDGLQTLSRLYDADCTRRALEARVTMAFEPAAAWTLVEGSSPPVLRGGLVVTRAAHDGPIVLDGAQGSVVLTPTMTPPATSPWLTIEPGAAGGRVSVDITISGRCGGHVLGEVKKPYEFEFFVDVGDGLQAYAVGSDPDLQQRMQDEVFFPGCGTSP